jgi:predicted Zn-dependent protease
LAVGTTQTVRLVETATGREFVRLADQLEDRPEYCEFSPDGGLLVVVSAVGRRIHVWDLRLIGAQLAEMGLAWDLPPFPSPPPISSPPLRLQVHRGVAEVQRLLTAQNYAEALAEADKEVTTAPENPDLWRLRALAQLGLEHYDQALADADRYFDARPDDSESLNDMASKMSVSPIDDERVRNRALVYAQQAVQKAPQKADYLDTLGVALYRNNQFQEAIQTLLEAGRQTTGGDPGLRAFFLAMAHARLQQADLARECYEQALAWRDAHGGLPAAQEQLLERVRTEADLVLGKKN